MRRLAWVPVIAFFLVGCQSGDPASSGGANPQVSKKTQEAEKPETDEATKIALLIGKRPPITVAYPDPQKIFESFRDPKYSGSEYDDLPPTFKFPYRARSWETAKMGFGEILYDGTLVAALYQDDKITQDQVDEMVNAHKEQVGGLLPDIVGGKRVTYWFWEIDKQRLMICAYRTEKKGTKLTIAMGDDKVLDALGISPQLARKNIGRIDAVTVQETFLNHPKESPHG